MRFSEKWVSVLIWTLDLNENPLWAQLEITLMIGVDLAVVADSCL
jgi:hypothetical protein